MRRKLSFLSGLLTNIFLAALIIAMYHATQPGGVLPVSAPQYRGSGEWAENNPALLMRMAAEGHEIASMGYYPDMDGRIGWIVKDVRRANEAVKKICGAEPAIYYEGSRNTVTSTLAAKKLKLTAVSSTIDLLTAKGTAADILSRLPEKPIEGSIILLRPTAACKEALSGIINAIEEKGIGLTCTGDVLGLSE